MEEGIEVMWRVGCCRWGSCLWICCLTKDSTRSSGGCKSDRCESILGICLCRLLWGW